MTGSLPVFECKGCGAAGRGLGPLCAPCAYAQIKQPAQAIRPCERCGYLTSGACEECAAEARAPGAQKADAHKPRVDLLPFDALEGAAQAFTYGAHKYSAHNWRKGMAWSRLLAATLRHLFAWANGEDRDPESGIGHLHHAAASILMLSESVRRGYGQDDRWKDGTP